jgi:hypothetical protein
MPTPKSLREAPGRIFENYILTLEVDPRTGLSKVPQESFLQIPGVAGNGGTLDAESSPLDIGFPFSFDGITYKKFVVSTNGFLVLLDPATVSLDLNTIFGSGVDYENSNIKQIFGANHALLTPWFDGSLRNLYSDQSSSGLSLSPQVIDSYQKGVSQPNARVNPRKFGIQFFNKLSSNSGHKLIVRWNSSSNGFSGNSPANTLRFEVVIFENGKIEFRYSPASNFADQDYDTYGGATIGIFMPRENRFRDFSYELGYRKNDRKRYKFGGTIYDPSYTDGDSEYTANYSVNLNPVIYWPGQKNSGAVFTFQPPLNRRRILPRASLRERDSQLTLPTVARTGDSRGGNSISTFDDRRSIAYKRDIVNYPTTIPRFYGETGLGLADRQNLFSGEFFLTGNVVKSLVQDFIGNDPQQYVTPFVENKLFENDPGSDVDSFYTVGSSVNDVGYGFKQPLKSKTQIRLSLRVDHKTRMFEASSSIYYYNSSTKRWQYPTASFQNGNFDIANPYTDAQANRLIEVDRGFNSFGFNISSGSSNSRIGIYNGTDPIFNEYWTKENEIQAISKKYNKSIQVNQSYSANQDEGFTLPINQPFLLEKAVIELPIEAGKGWFDDKTQCFIPLPANPYSNSFDIGGPALTVGLFNQIKLGTNGTRRDLILSGTITHQFDNSAEIKYSQSTDIGDVEVDSTYAWQIMPIGFNAYGGYPTSVISGSLKNGKYQFTGSVALKCVAESSNGVLIKDVFTLNQNDLLHVTEALYLLFNTQKWNTPSTNGTEDFITQGAAIGKRYRSIINVNPFGRGGTGFEPSGRSILGKEFIQINENLSFYDNPFFLYQGPNTRDNLEDIVDSNPTFPKSGRNEIFYASAVTSRQTSSPSPYLVFPGDKLILSVSKSRPHFFSNQVSKPYTSGSIQHDIKLTTGSINITLYGSLVSNGQEFHDTLNQPLASDSIHEVVVGETKTW